MRLAVFLFALAFATTLSACKTHCRQLSEKLCDCASTKTDNTSCLQGVSTREANSPPTAEDEAICESLLNTCDCRLIDTAQGKERCGLAVMADGGI